jgi:hypothetical protein
MDSMCWNTSPVVGTGPWAILPAVEQHTDPIIQPMPTAGTDPAHIPGLISPARTETGQAARAAPEGAAEPRPEGADAAAETSRSAASATTAEVAEADAQEQPPDAEAEEAEAKAEEAEAEEAEAEEAEAEAETDGPVFKVSDHRGSITAHRTGITFRLDGETAEFRWDEIGAVEIDTPRFSRLFTVTVYTSSSRRWYEAYVQASAKRLLKEWTAELDAVLDTCFDEATA